MIKYAAVVLVVVSVFLSMKVFADSLAVQWKSNQRTLKISRHYEIAVQKDKESVAMIPTLMSFWGQSNWQVVKSSKFQYSEKPDKEEVTSDNLGMCRKNYALTWNAPKADKITVDQTLEVELTCFGTIYTAAKLPYAEAIKTRFASSLGADKDRGVDPDIKEIEPICADILKKAKDAEDAVERVCDWVNENIKFDKGKRSAEEAIKEKKGSCTPMSLIACSMLRRMGIPAEPVEAKFINSDGGHCYMEVYFPDAGWIFYDLSNHTRGFKSLDCIMTAGWSYRSGTPGSTKWEHGYFMTEKDSTPFKDQSDNATKVLRKTPVGMPVSCANVVKSAAPQAVKARHRPIKELIMDVKVPLGTRENTESVFDPGVVK